MEGRQLLGLGSGLLGGGPLSSLSTLSTLNTAMKLQQLQNIQKLQQLQKERYCNCDSRPNYNQQGKIIFLEIFLILTSLDSHDHQQSSRPSNTVTVTNNRDQSYEDSNLSSLYAPAKHHYTPTSQPMQSVDNNNNNIDLTGRQPYNYIQSYGK